MNESIEQIRQALKDRPQGFTDRTGRGASAVCIPLLPGPDGCSVLFEVRAQKLKRQPGEVCFPGGRLEGEETPAQAAVRETAEELLLRREQVEILAPMDGILGSRGAPLWPYLGTITGYRDTFSPEEVQRVFCVPLSWFYENEPRIYKTRLTVHPEEDFPYHLIPDGRDYNWGERIQEVVFYERPEAVIWGITAKILHDTVHCLMAAGITP